MIWRAGGTAAAIAADLLEMFAQLFVFTLAIVLGGSLGLAIVLKLFSYLFAEAR